MPRWDVQVSLNRQRAICSGQETYQGTPCKHGHPGIRFVKWNGKCVDCHIEGRPSYFGEDKTNRRYDKDGTYYAIHREKIKQKYKADPLKFLLRGARARAKKKGLEFSLEYKDLAPLPEVCPISGRPMLCGTPDAASLDRVDNSKGYTRDNVRVISKRMNGLKRDLTAVEVAALLQYMRDELLS